MARKDVEKLELLESYEKYYKKLMTFLNEFGGMDMRSFEGMQTRYNNILKEIAAFHNEQFNEFHNPELESLDPEEEARMKNREDILKFLFDEQGVAMPNYEKKEEDKTYLDKVIDVLKLHKQATEKTITYYINHGASSKEIEDVKKSYQQIKNEIRKKENERLEEMIAHPEYYEEKPNISNSNVTYRSQNQIDTLNFFLNSNPNGNTTVTTPVESNENIEEEKQESNVSTSVYKFRNKINMVFANCVYMESDAMHPSDEVNILTGDYTFSFDKNKLAKNKGEIENLFNQVEGINNMEELMRLKNGEAWAFPGYLGLQHLIALGNAVGLIDEFVLNSAGRVGR